MSPVYTGLSTRVLSLSARWGVEGRKGGSMMTNIERELAERICDALLVLVARLAAQYRVDPDIVVGILVRTVAAIDATHRRGR